MGFDSMYKKSISFYKTSVPGCLLVVIFLFVLCFGFFKAVLPDVFYQRATGKIDTAITGLAYYQNNHTLKLKLEPGSLVLQQGYPTWWYAPHPMTADLKSGKEVTVFVKKSTDRFYGIQAESRIIQPAWFDILNTYFNATATVVLLLSCLILITVYHYGEVIKNVFLWMPYAIGLIVLAIFWGYLNLIFLLIIAIVLLKYILKKRKDKQTSSFAPL